MTEAPTDYAAPVADGRPPYPGGLEYDPDQRRVSVRFLTNYSRRGRLYRSGEIVHNVPLSVAKELRANKPHPVVEPYKAPGTAAPAAPEEKAEFGEE